MRMLRELCRMSEMRPPLTKGQLRCLLLGVITQQANCEGIRGIDIASALGVSRASIRKILATLTEKGYLIHQKQQMYLLSDTGKDLMERMLPLYEKIFYYFHQIVHLSEFDAREGALALVITLNEDNLKDLCKHL